MYKLLVAAASLCLLLPPLSLAGFEASPVQTLSLPARKGPPSRYEEKETSPPPEMYSATDYWGPWLQGCSSRALDTGSGPYRQGIVSAAVAAKTAILDFSGAPEYKRFCRLSGPDRPAPPSTKNWAKLDLDALSRDATNALSGLEKGKSKLTAIIKAHTIFRAEIDAAAGNQAKIWSAVRQFDELLPGSVKHIKELPNAIAGVEDNYGRAKQMAEGLVGMHAVLANQKIRWHVAGIITEAEYLSGTLAQAEYSSTLLNNPSQAPPNFSHSSELLMKKVWLAVALNEVDTIQTCAMKLAEYLTIGGPDS